MAKNYNLKILVIQTAFLGDVILSSPVISNLKTIYPQSEIYTLTTPLAAQFFKFDPRVKEALVFKKRDEHSGIFGLLKLVEELRKIDFDKIFSLHRSIRTSLLVSKLGVKDTVGFQDAWGSFLYKKRVKKAEAPHAVLRYLSILELQNPNIELELYPDPNYKVPEGDYICLFPGSEWYTKRWQGYREAAEILISKGKKVVVLGSPQEKAHNKALMNSLPVLDLTGETSIPQTMTIVSKARGVICNDSMALHIASAFKIPRISVFCATSPKFGFGPWGERGAVIEDIYLPCKPCRRHGSRRCPTGSNLCMTRVSPKEVVLRLDELSN